MRHGAAVSSDPGSEETGETPTVSADEFLKEFTGDPDATNKKYGGREVRITGVVQDMYRNYDDSVTMLNLSRAFEDEEALLCFPVDQRPWLKVKPGQTVTLKARYESNILTPILRSAQVVDAQDFSLPEYAADELAREYAADPDRVARDHTHLVVTGMVVSKESVPNELNPERPFPEVVLETDGDVAVRCRFLPTAVSEAGRARVGARTRLLGRLAKEQADPNVVFVEECLSLDSE